MGSRSRIRLLVSALILMAGCAGVGISSAPVSVAAGGTTNLVLQQMDSCKQALGGSAYQLTGAGVDIRASAPSQSKQRVASSPNCPLQQGDCVSVTVGCMTFTGVPAPGTYRIHETRTADPDASNPEGYAACNGGSACRSQVINVTVDSSGGARAQVTNEYPDGTLATYPTASQHGGSSSYAGTASDPIVVHNFGLAAPSSDLSLQCDGDGDADDHLTGTPSAHCAYPENLEASACQPYPWSCTLGIDTAGGVTSTTTKSTKTTTSKSKGTVNGPDADAVFIARIYQDALGRPATAAEIAYWKGVLSAGGGRGSVGLAVIDSTEYHRRVVNGDYGLVGRAPDAPGLAFWTSMLDRGTYNEAVEAGFAASDEYYAVRGGGTPAGFVTALYRDFLGRLATAAEIAYWTARVAHGTPRGAITGGFTYSHENHANLVNGWYRYYLGRSPDPGGLAFWSGYLDQGGRDETIEAGLIGSPEYLARAMS